MCCTSVIQIATHFPDLYRKEGRKEMFLFNDALNTFYLRLYGIGHMVNDHSDIKRGRKKGNILFNNTLNTFYWCLYGIGHMVKDHSDIKRVRKKGII